MLNKTELRKIAGSRLAEARILCRKKNRKYEGVVHLCVCAIEIALKKIICDVLNWRGFPETRSEFEGFESFKTHNPQILLALSGQERKIKKDVNMWADWSILQDLNIEIRYAPIGKINDTRAKEILSATSNLLKFLNIIKQ